MSMHLHRLLGALTLAWALPPSPTLAQTPEQAPGARSTADSTLITSARIGGALNTWTPGSVVVFATSAMYIANAQGAKVHRVDARQQLTDELNAGGLPGDPEQAAAVVRKRMQMMGPDLARRVEATLAAVEQTMVYGIERVPAIVFDARRVVYGVTDVAQAADIVRRGGGQPIEPQFTPGQRDPRSSLGYQRPSDGHLAPTPNPLTRLEEGR